MDGNLPTKFTKYEIPYLHKEKKKKKNRCKIYFFLQNIDFENNS